MKEHFTFKTSGFLFLITGILMFFSLRLSSQPANLVLNPSFEDTLGCGAFPPFSLMNWVGTSGSPDYFNDVMYCSGNGGGFHNFWADGIQYSHSGNAYVGFALYCPASFCGSNYRENIQSELLDTLQLNKKYCVSFFVNLANKSKHAIDDIECLFSYVDAIPFPASAQLSNFSGNIITDTSSWTQIYGLYNGQGNEVYINLGNFKNDANTTVIMWNSSAAEEGSYYFIDDVSIYELPEIDAGADDSLYIGNNVQLNANCIGCWPGLQYRWFPSEGLNDTTVLNPVATPAQTTTYYFGLIDTTGTISCMQDHIDSVTVYVNGVGIHERDWSSKVHVYPNPAKTIVSVELQLTNNETGFIQLFDLLGNLVSVKKLNAGSNKTEFDLSELSNGIYIYKVNINGELKISDKLIIQ